MTRGGSIKRTKDVRIRLTPEEWETWQAAREKSGRRELGAWARAVVNELLTKKRAGRRPGDLEHHAVPEVNVEAFLQLVGVARNLNQLARWCNSEGRAAEGARLARLANQAEAASRAVRGLPVPASLVDVDQVDDAGAVQERPGGRPPAPREPGRSGWRRLLDGRSA